MQKDLKIIEEMIEVYRSCVPEEDFDMRVDIGFMKEEVRALENLLTRYKQLEEENKKFNPEIWHNEGWDRADEYWKSKVKEKIEELEEEKLKYDNGLRIYTLRNTFDFQKEVLQELLREEK